MELGCFLTPYFPGDVHPCDNADDLLNRAEICRSYGYDYVQVADHHVTPEGHFFQNAPTAGRLAAIFDRVAVLFLLPLYHPLFVAEYIGTLGAFVDRIELWCAIGSNQAAFDAVGIPMKERGERFEESLTVIERLLSGERVTFSGDHYAVDDVAIGPTAEPRICVGGLARPAIERAGRRGDAWVAHPSEGDAELARKIDWFRDAGGDTVITRRDALLLENGDLARRRANELLEQGYRGWGVDANWVITGYRDDASNALGELRDEGVDEVVVGAMDHDCAMETFRAMDRANKEL